MTCASPIGLHTDKVKDSDTLTVRAFIRQKWLIQPSPSGVLDVVAQLGKASECFSMCLGDRYRKPEDVICNAIAGASVALAAPLKRLFGSKGRENCMRTYQ